MVGVMDYLISIIVPIYNSEKTIDRCINSLINQTYKNIEIILIDDGSIDNSLELCQIYQKNDNRIKVISKKNEGVGKTRNVGLFECSGDYVMFVDADDYIDQIMTKLMIDSILRNNTNIALCNYYNVYEGDRKTKNLNISINSLEVEESRYLIKRIISLMKDRVSPACWRGLYKKSLLTENNIFFSDLKMSEDFKFIIEVLMNVKLVSIVDKPLYYFVCNPLSATHKYINTLEKNMQYVNKWLYDNLILAEPNFKNQYKALVLNTFITIVGNVCKKGTLFTVRERYIHIKKVYYSNIYSDFNKELYNLRSKLPRKVYIQLLMMKFHMSFILILYHTLKNKTF